MRRVLRVVFATLVALVLLLTIAQFERPFRVAGTAAELRTLVGHGLPGVSLGELSKIEVRRAVIWGTEDDVDSVASGRASAAALGVRLELVSGAAIWHCCQGRRASLL